MCKSQFIPENKDKSHVKMYVENYSEVQVKSLSFPQNIKKTENN